MTIKSKIAECEKGCGKHIDNAYDDGDRYYDGSCGEESYCEECVEKLQAYKEAQAEIDELNNEIRQYKFWNEQNEKVLQATRKQFIELEIKMIDILNELKSQLNSQQNKPKALVQGDFQNQKGLNSEELSLNNPISADTHNKEMMELKEKIIEKIKLVLLDYGLKDDNYLGELYRDIIKEINSKKEQTFQEKKE